MIMHDKQSKEQLLYISPEVEVWETHVEGCFASSLEDPIENPEIEWQNYEFEDDYKENMALFRCCNGLFVLQ